MKPAIVHALMWLCEHTHWITSHYGGCQLATLSFVLDERWGTGQWKSTDATDEAKENGP